MAGSPKNSGRRQRRRIVLTTKRRTKQFMGERASGTGALSKKTAKGKAKRRRAAKSIKGFRASMRKAFGDTSAARGSGLLRDIKG